MKKRALLFVVTIFFIGSFAYAEEPRLSLPVEVRGTNFTGKYVAVKGDTLESVANKIWGSSALAVVLKYSNNISDSLKAGQELEIPRILYPIKIKGFQTSPYGAKSQKGDQKSLKAITDSGYKNDIKEKMKTAVNNADPTPFILKKGERADCVTDGVGGMHCNPEGYVFDWDKVSEVNAHIWPSIKIGENEYCDLFIIDNCGNFNSYCYSQNTVVAQIIASPVAREERKVVPQPVESAKEAVAQKPAESVVTKQDYSNRWFTPELIAGGGLYNGTEGDHTGDYEWLRGRFMPFSLGRFKGNTLKLGGFVSYAQGGGDDNAFKYAWWKIAGGPSLQIINDNFWDLNFEPGFGALSMDGAKEYYYSNTGYNLILLTSYFSYYKRLKEGKKWFPITEVGMEVNIPFNYKMSHHWKDEILPPEFKNYYSFELVATQHIYKLDIYDKFYLMPGLKASIGREFADPASTYAGIGPNLCFSYQGWNFLQIGSRFKYAFDLGYEKSQFQPITGQVDFLGWIYLLN